MSDVSSSTTTQRVVGLAVLLPLLAALLVTAFAWPSARTEPRGVPIAVAGPEEAQAVMTGRLAPAGSEMFEIRRAADRDAPP